MLCTLGIGFIHFGSLLAVESTATLLRVRVLLLVGHYCSDTVFVLFSCEELSRTALLPRINRGDSSSLDSAIQAHSIVL